MYLTAPCFEAEKYITGRKNYITGRKNGRKKSMAWMPRQMMMQDLDLTHEGLSCEND